VNAGDPLEPSTRIVETAIFSKQIDRLIGDIEKQALLDELISDPASGDLIKGSGGCRKLRWAAHGRGKSGGIRIIYFWKRPDLMYLLVAYPKNVKDDLSAAELKELKKLVRQELGA
jgi:hypothetical protein